MKQLALILSLFFLMSCNSQKTASENKVQEDNNYTFVYNKSTRRTNVTVTVTEKETIISNKSAGTLTETATMPQTWKTLTSLIKEVDLQGMSMLEAPTKKHYSDQLPAAYLSVTYKGHSYNSVQFDHGYPPAEIASVVNEMVSLTETNK
ncbi:hypothetical protein NBRC110019_29570 [Neptunitalea chrysea]|uniref:Lipoprotein n=1 Tax=Neptunitalea chrysea TaxID=1647581 RepID=A0A9W6EW77_9FLAO|nr:hypothetical protein [Neptunitalea chrysea]GLB53916.1 hypothetical protein NBRC110019_29570 [Neptunitalea chrysea]